VTLCEGVGGYAFVSDSLAGRHVIAWWRVAVKGSVDNNGGGEGFDRFFTEVRCDGFSSAAVMSHK
jgi:hypothetical protein